MSTLCTIVTIYLFIYIFPIRPIPRNIFLAYNRVNHVCSEQLTDSSQSFMNLYLACR